MTATRTTIDSFTGEYDFLSNFSPAAVAYDGIFWITVEHAYQAAKTVIPGERLRIHNGLTPGQAKKAGRKVTLRPDWEKIKVGVMSDLLACKFAVGSRLADQLLATGNAVLIEGNTWGDRFWGKVNGKGENWLGLLLMERRNFLSQQAGNDHID